jgi:4-hydroxy-2-oxoheptanedioate aldolase
MLFTSDRSCRELIKGVRGKKPLEGIFRLQRNVVKEKLKAGGTVYGTSLGEWLDPELPVLLSAAGLDFFFIDTEHSATGYDHIKGLCRTARSSGIVPLVRVTKNSSMLISRALDVGAMGIIVPGVNSADEARAALDAMKFPPIGHRRYGLGGIVTDFKGIQRKARSIRQIERLWQ